MANPLDWAARAILQLNGMSPDQIKTKARQIKRQGPKKPMPKANTSAPQPEKKAPVTRKTRVQGRVRPGAVNRSTQAGQPKPVRQGPRTANVKQQVNIGPRSAQKPDGPIGPNSRYTPRSQQKPDGKAPSKTLRKLQQAAKTKPKSAAPKPVPKSTPKSTTKAGPGTSSRPLGTADVGPKGEVGRLGQRTGMKGNSPKPQLNAPKPGVKAPTPGSTQVKGQTNLMNSKGEPRDFRNPKVSAGRQPTTTPVSTRSSAQATPPNRPIGGSFGNQPKGQGYLNLGAGERTGIKDPWGPGTNPRPGQKPATKPQAAKPQKPASSGKSVAPTVKGPVQRPGISGRVKTLKDILPNSAKQNTSLPRDGAAYLRGVTQGPKAPTSKPAAKPTAQPAASKPASTAPKPAAKPNPYTSGKPNPNAAGPGVKSSFKAPAAALGRRLSIGRGGLAQVALELANAADNSRLTPSQLAKKYEVNNPNRGQMYLDKLQAGTLGQPVKAKPKPDTSKSAKAASTPTYQRPQAQVNKPSSTKQAADKRDKKKLF